MKWCLMVVFLITSLRNDGLLQEYKVCLVQNRDSKSLKEDKVAERCNAILESKKKWKFKAWGGVVINTTESI
jgi:hypothetical protein